jgi:citrate lyase beta subunit
MKLGAEDLCADMGMTRSTAGTELLYARSCIATHAAAFGLQAIGIPTAWLENASC